MSAETINISALVRNFKMTRGDGVFPVFTIKSDGVAENITDDEIILTIRKNLRSTEDPISEISATKIEPEAGQCTFNFSESVWTAIADRDSTFYDIQQTKPGENPETLFVGQLKISPDSSK